MDYGRKATFTVCDSKKERIRCMKKKVPDGYVCAEDMEIEIKETADTQRFVMKDDPIQVEIEKIDYDNGDSLPGATLQLIDKDENIVDEWTTDGKPHSLYAKIQP